MFGHGFYDFAHRVTMFFGLSPDQAGTATGWLFFILLGGTMLVGGIVGAMRILYQLRLVRDFRRTGNTKRFLCDAYDASAVFPYGARRRKQARK